MVPWRSWLAHRLVAPEVVGSNPTGIATSMFVGVHRGGKPKPTFASSEQAIRFC